MVLAAGLLALSAPMCVACLLTHLRPVILISSHPIARRIGVQDISTRVVMRSDDIGVKNVPLGLLAARMVCDVYYAYIGTTLDDLAVEWT
ncbi:hypothetical protein K439DRAFT_1638047 [Ramaria rubella]|nr:hypothetical protein K439DRAFT_1638047 [Ramaria rubella]